MLIAPSTEKTQQCYLIHFYIKLFQKKLKGNIGITAFNKEAGVPKSHVVNLAVRGPVFGNLEDAQAVSMAQIAFESVWD